MLRKSLLLILILGLAPSLSFAQAGRPVKQVADADIVGNMTWSKDTVYVLNGFVFVESGETLTIEAGTVVKGKPGQGTSASALIVARGGKLYARGSSSKPIIFTAEADDVDSNTDIQAGTRGLWGGVILLGNARINNAGGTANIEGIPSTETRGQFGGVNDHDNSGAMQYVSIRYGGTNIGAANEINGLTFGGVGDSTTIDHIEVVHNADDGYEWFGGTVNTRYLVSAFNDDDAFDYDTGWRGKNQFWFALQGEVGNRGAEMDGADTPVDGLPYAIPTIYNATYIGSGAASTQTNNDIALLFRVNAGGKYYNGLFTDFYGKALDIEDLASGKDSRERLDSLDLVLQHNLFYGFGTGTTWTDLVKNGATTGAFAVTYMSNAANKNEIANPLLYGISRTANGQLDPRPKSGSPALSGAATAPSDGFFTQAAYKGAFGPNAADNWLRGWTYLDQAGYVATPTESGKPVKVVSDADIKTTTTFKSDTIYVLNGFVFVESGETLTIEAGTVIKGKPGQGANASALIVARGGKLYARGSSSKPIIFTAEADDVNSTTDIQAGTRGLWGGVILLGNARINNAGGVANIEGIPSTETRGQFGGVNDRDNSGAMQYCSIRYGGTNIGAANEINGLTMGGVGDSTTIDHIEVVHNADDGFEWFGGTVNTKYLISAFNDDDAFDYDTGWRGKNQFWFALQGEVGNRGAEMDGADTPVDGLPYAIPLIYNATYIGSGASSTQTNNDIALLFRVNAGGKYYNGLFTDFYGKALDIEDLASGKDSRERLDSLDLVLQHNLFYGFGSGSSWTDIVKNGATTGAFAVTYMSNAANKNEIANPMLYGISRTANGQLDPRPKSGSPALSGAATAPSDGFFTAAAYKGAFGPNAGDNWLRGWTYLDETGYVATPQESGKPVKVVSDADIKTNTTFKADTIYTLNGFVFVESGETLTIEAGTVIKGKPGQGTNASALIVARGGKIYAQGTAVKPIIFTAEADNVDDLTDIQAGTRGLWGGVILLGKARINNAGGVANIEGIPSTEARGQFGGTDDRDNSGVMQYCSIRYGGTNIGAANEINGLTFGGVGDGTTIDHIEVFNNADDGFEWFGGTVNTKYLISAFNDDDAFDYDTGWRGKNQFWFALQGEVGNRGAEMDGADTPVDGVPYAIPLIYNATYIGSGAASTQTNNDIALLFRVNAGGKYYNGLFTDFYGKALDIEDLASGKDSRERLDSLDLVLQHNLFYGFGAGSSWTDIVKNGATTGAFAVTYMNNAANSNQIADPKLRGISRTTNAMLDPRPEFGSPALSGAATAPSDGFFTAADYKGAFNATENWALGWSFLDKSGYFSHTVYQDTTQHDTTSTKKNCDFNLDSKSDVSDVIFMLLLSRSNPTDSRLDWNKDGQYMINDAISLLLDIRNGNCKGSTLLLASAGLSAAASSSDKPVLSAEELDYLETQIKAMGLSEDEQSELRLAMYGSGVPASLPKAFALAQNSPNPFNPSTTISFAVPEGSNSNVSLKIFDIRGRTIRTLVDEARTPGTYQVFWDGTDNRGGTVASGVYLYRMQAGDFVMTRKMVLLR